MLYSELKGKFDALEHAGVKGMKWGRRNKFSVGTQRSRNSAYKAKPTVREYFSGTGKTVQERDASRQKIGSVIALAYMASTASRMAVITIPSLKQYKTGVNVVAKQLQGTSLIVGGVTTVAGIIDRKTNKDS